MSLNVAFNLFDEYEALNGSFCDPEGISQDGYWVFIGALFGSFPYTLCLSNNGTNWQTQVINNSSQALVNVNIHNPWVDLSGGNCSCVGNQSAYNEFYFSYVIPAANGCAQQQKALVISVVNNVVSIQRTHTACFYELYGVNPVSGTNDAPAITMKADYITPSLEYDLRLIKRPLENCGAGNVTILDEAIDSGVSIASYTPNSAPQGPILRHSIQTSSAITTGGYIHDITLAGYGTLNLSSIVHAGNFNSFRLAVQNSVISTLNTGGYKYHLNVTEGDSAGTVEFIFTCANGSPWVGIDKTSATLRWCPSGGCTEGTLSSTSTVEQIVGGDFTFEQFRDSGECGFLNCTVSLCPNRTELEIFNEAASNWNSITLQNTTGRKYYIYDIFEPGSELGRRAKICQDTSVLISGGNCPAGYATESFSWQNGGSNPKEFDPLEQDVAISTCGDCTDEEGFCYPLADDVGDMGFSGVACSNAGASTHTYTTSGEQCGGGTPTYTAMEAPLFGANSLPIQTSTPNAGTKQVQLTTINLQYPRTCYVPYRYITSLGQWSNWGLIRCNITKGNCCE